jgi:hypothetical protein
MAKPVNLDQLEALKKQQSQLQAKIAAMEARQKEQDRKNDTRRKVIAGALALEHMAKNPKDQFSRKLFALLDEYVPRSSDRALFPDLPAEPSVKSDAEKASGTDGATGEVAQAAE